MDTIHDVANEIDDTEDDVKNALSAITGIGVSLIVTCPATGGTTCVIASGLFGAGMGYLVGEDMYLDDTTVENLGKVADMFAHATPNEQGLISVSMSFQSESGDSMVQFDENTRYLEMNPSFHEDQFELQIGGRTITLTPAQAIIVNAILGGGLLP